VAAWRPGDGGAEPEAAALGGSEARAWREAKRGWERCGEVQGWCSPFYRGPGSAGEGWPGFNASINGFNAIEEGGRGGSRGAELGGAGWLESGGGTGELGRPEVRDGADSRGPLDRETRKRRQAQKARTKRENVLSQIRYRYVG
jgi:hypothetical protein